MNANRSHLYSNHGMSYRSFIVRLSLSYCAYFSASCAGDGLRQR